MRRRNLVVAAISAAVVAWAAMTAGPVPEVRAAENAVYEDFDTEDVGVAHAGCIFFGEQREQFLKSSLAASLEGMTQRAALTAAVAAELPGPRAMPSRSRTGVRRQAQNNLESASSIDEFIFATLALRGIPAAPMTTDAEFLRRASLDLTGRIPTMEEVVAFLTDPGPDKRSRAIDRLLDSEGWAWRWALFFGDLFRNTTFTSQVNRYPDGRDAFALYLIESLRENKPYDQMAREMLAASGVSDGRTYPERYSSYDDYLAIRRDYPNNPVTPTPVTYIVGGVTRGGPIQDTFDTLAATVARDFLGVSHMDCILCHDGAYHLDSLSVWGSQAKRLEAWQLASFFSGTRMRRPPRTPPQLNGQPGRRPNYWLTVDIPRGGYRLNTDTGNRPERSPQADGGNELVTPVYAFTGGAPAPGESWREALGRLLTADPQFSRAIVNYIWREFYGRGLVEPADQFDLARLDASNPPEAPWTLQASHPELLNFLATQFAENGFDLKWLMREIANSRAYQLSARYEGAWNAQYEPYFARRIARRLSAEQMHDALVIAGGAAYPYNVSPTFRGLVFAQQFPDVQNVPGRPRLDSDRFENLTMSFLDAFFRGDREETARNSEGSILQALQLMNSPLVLLRTSAAVEQSALAQLLSQPDDVLVQALYLRTLSRPPAPEELSAGVQLLASGDRAQKAEDLTWSLLNSIEFLFNY